MASSAKSGTVDFINRPDGYVSEDVAGEQVRRPMGQLVQVNFDLHKVQVVVIDLTTKTVLRALRDGDRFQISTSSEVESQAIYKRFSTYVNKYMLASWEELRAMLPEEDGTSPDDPFAGLSI